MTKLIEFSTPNSDGLQPHFSQYTMVMEGIGAIIDSTETCRIRSGKEESQTSPAIRKLPA